MMPFAFLKSRFWRSTYPISTSEKRFAIISYVSLVAKGVICGLGAKGYELALTAVADLLKGKWLIHVAAA